MSENGAGPPLPEGRHLELPGRGTTLVREVRGPRRAPTVMLLHGLTATAALNWFASFGPLGRYFRVVAIDQRGHGDGIRGPGGFSLDDCADDVAAVAGALGLERFIAVGYSLGGLVAQLAWRRHPQMIEGLVLCSTDRSLTGSPLERLMFLGMPMVTAAARMARPGYGLGADVVGDSLIGRLDEADQRAWARSEMRQTSLATVIAAASAAGRFSSAAWIGDVDVPTAVVITARDQVVPLRRQLRLAHSVPGATVHMVDGNHGCCVTQPELFVPTLVEACRSVAARRPPTAAPKAR